MKNSYIVYKHTSPSGKVYIGLTSQTPSARWRGGMGYRHNERFFRAILKYGWDNFTHEVLFDGLSLHEACEVESELIAAFNSTDDRYGYNLTTGGEGCPGSKRSDDYRREQSEKVKTLWTDPVYRAHMVQVHKNHKHGPDQVRKMKEHHAGGLKPKAVICLDTGEIYRSLRDATRATGVSDSQISKCCNNVRGFYTAGGLRWAFYQEEEQIDGSI